MATNKKKELPNVVAINDYRKNSGLSEEMQKNIDAYADKIKQIKDFITAVRKRPGMYIGPRGSAGFLNMQREVIQNSLDQLIKVESPCDTIGIEYDERDQHTIVWDNGLGLPYDKMIDIYTKAHVSGNFEKKPGEYSAGLNGIGAKATNGLSRVFIAISYSYKGDARRIEFHEGRVFKDQIIKNPEHRQGTFIEFWPDNTIMGDTSLDARILLGLVRDMLSQTRVNSGKILFRYIDIEGKVVDKVLTNENGILANLLAKCSNMVIPPVVIFADTGTMLLNAAFTFDPDHLDGENISSFANMCPTSNVPQNSHVSGFLDGVTFWFTKYMNNVYLPANTKAKITANDVKAGLAAMISAFHLNPDFTGQAKEVFSNQDYRPFAKKVVIDALDQWSKDKPNDVQKAAKFLKDVADARVKSEREKIKVTAKYATSAVSGLPAKYRKPVGPPTLGWELIIVEGDSALSSAADGRDKMRQGLFPIRGKILNVYNATMDKIQANAEIMGIANILGAGYGKNFDITKVKFKKIIFMADADPDGSHICSLLLLLFLKMFPGMIESGMVYKAVPPLYGIEAGKVKGEQKMKYFTERIDYARYMQKEFTNKNKVLNSDKAELTANQLIEILLRYEDYTWEIDKMSHGFKVDQCLLEKLLIAHIQGKSFTQIRKMMTTEYRFINNDNVAQIGDTIKIKGLVDDQVQTIFFNQEFLNRCKPIIDFLDRAISMKQTMFYLNGVQIGLYTLVNTVQESTAGGMHRYKGLGEMKPAQLAESTLAPDSNRELIQYTTDNIKQDIQIIRNYNSDKKLILKKIDVIRRIDLLG